MIFQPVTLEWEGKQIEIPANRVAQAIAVVEERLTFDEALEMFTTRKFKRMKIAQAFADLLRFLGHTADADEIFAAMHRKEGILMNLMGVLQALMLLMIPPPEVARATTGESGGRTQKKSSSKKCTKL